jgi:hypothetical protein
MRVSAYRLPILALLSLATMAGCETQQQRIDAATAQVQRLADDLDRRTTDTGVYVRAKDGEIKETDPWGSLVRVTYSQGGLAEEVLVRSAGPDREFHTADDIVATGIAANLKGIGEGIKRNVEATAAGAAKGVVKGAVAGVKESIREALPRKSDDTEAIPPVEAPQE